MRPLNLRNTAMLIACVTLTTACMPVLSNSLAQRPDGAHSADLSKLLDSADANGDGVITRDEFLAARAAFFSRLDRNGDGFIDASDVPAMARARSKAKDRLAELVAQLDKDGDGRVSKAEFVDGPTPLFDRADTDHNGELSRDEVAAVKAAAAK